MAARLGCGWSWGILGRSVGEDVREYICKLEPAEVVLIKTA